MAEIWKLKVTSVSEVDAGGALEVGFDAYRDNKIVFPNLSVRGTPDTLLDSAKRKVADLRQAIVQAGNIRVGMEIIIT